MRLKISLNRMNSIVTDMTSKAKVCRICLLGNIKGVISLFTVYNGSDRIYSKVMEVANIQISVQDGLPTWICYSCLVHLETSYQFKMQAEKSDQLLRKQLEITNTEETEKFVDDGENPLQEQTEIQGHFMSEVTEGDGSEIQDGIKITNVVSQAQPELLDVDECPSENRLADLSDNDARYIPTPACICTEGQDDAQRNACLKIPSRPTVKSEGGRRLSYSELTASVVSVVVEGDMSGESGVLMKKKVEASRDRYKCKTCSKGFKRISHLHLHTQVHSDGEMLKSQGKYKCPVCDEGFQFKTLLKVHLASHNGIKPYKCDNCEKTFLHEERLETHKYLHNEESPIKCNICGKKFKHKFHLSNHMTSHSDQSGVCEYCGKFYTTYSGLHTHMQIHHSDDPVKFVQCEQCGKSFASMAHLKKHIRRHEVEPMTCEACNKTYPNRNCLKKHRSTVHSNKVKHECLLCKKTFKHLTSLNVHVHSKHSDKDKPKCGICYTTFSQKAALKTHIKIIHSGLQPYSCKHCKTVFKWKQTCDKHELNCLVSAQ